MLCTNLLLFVKMSFFLCSKVNTENDNAAINEHTHTTSSYIKVGNENEERKKRKNAFHAWWSLCS